jgi:hypothetical protein
VNPTPGPPALPPSRRDFDAAEQLEKNEAGRLALVRGRSEKWLGGLTALTGLLGTVLIIKGPASATDIPIAWRIAVAAVVAASLGLLALATVRAYRSAYGDPGSLLEIDHTQLAGLAARLERARRRGAHAAQKDLKVAVRSTFAAVALLAVAIGLTWFAPSSSARKVCISVNGKVAVVVAATSLPVGSVSDGVTIGKCP